MRARGTQQESLYLPGQSRVILLVTNKRKNNSSSEKYRGSTLLKGVGIIFTILTIFTGYFLSKESFNRFLQFSCNRDRLDRKALLCRPKLETARTTMCESRRRQSLCFSRLGWLAVGHSKCCRRKQIAVVPKLARLQILIWKILAKY